MTTADQGVEGTDGHQAGTEGVADPTAQVVGVLLRAATALAGAERRDEACQLVAEAWTAVRESRADLAARLTAALHGLTGKSQGGEESGKSSASSAGSDAELDVRSLAPAQRHQLIFSTYDALAAGTAFVLVNDHDPRPLGYQLEAEHRGEYTWDYLEAGPTVWRVRIGRPLA